jgi:hypothetical protein
MKKTSSISVNGAATLLGSGLNRRNLDQDQRGELAASVGHAARGRRLRRRRAARWAKTGAKLAKILDISPAAAARLIGGNRSYIYAWRRIARSGDCALRQHVLAGEIPLPAAAANTPRLNRSNTPIG